MQAVLLIGLQASGKSTFYKNRLADTHIRLNLDMLRTRHREQVILRACLDAKQPFAIDNTNPTRHDRALYITAAREHKFRITGYFFRSVLADCLARNNARQSPVARPGVLGTHARLELPSADEGFDELFFVSINPEGDFDISPWIAPAPAPPQPPSSPEPAQ